MVDIQSSIGPIRLVVIQSTPFCNLDCDYCYLPNRDSKQRLSLVHLERIFVELFKSQLLAESITIVWHAGEPLAMPIAFYQAAFTLIAQLHKQHAGYCDSITHAFQTNATMLSQDWCALFQEHHVQIGVSLDGPSFIHDAHRKTRTGVQTHASTMRGIEQLKANQIPFHVISVLTQDALAYPEAIFQFFSNHNITQIGFNIDEKEGVHSDSSYMGEGAADRYCEFMQIFSELVKRSGRPFQIREFESLKHVICFGSSERMPENSQVIPFQLLTIDLHGNFSTFSPELLSMNCDDYGDFMLGNLLTDSLASALQKPKFQAIHRDITAGVELCRLSCEYFSLCGGGAPANKYYENGSFVSTETIYCKCNIKILTDIILPDIESSLI
jgi:uncharacterized protein